MVFNQIVDRFLLLPPTIHTSLWRKKTLATASLDLGKFHDARKAL